MASASLGAEGHTFAELLARSRRFGSAGEGSETCGSRGAVLDEYSRTEVECTTTVTVTVIVVACQNPELYTRRLCFHGHGLNDISRRRTYTLIQNS